MHQTNINPHATWPIPSTVKAEATDAHTPARPPVRHTLSQYSQSYSRYRTGWSVPRLRKRSDETRPPTPRITGPNPANSDNEGTMYMPVILQLAHVALKDARD
eukprot:2240704-Pyramimonas_sp.AAC.2